ncbi:glycosyltransferase family 2 protein [archaeon]|nr:glycosyltransferase family 2 protein [archaeon]
MITVVVPSRNEEKNIRACLEALRSVLPDARIIVIDRSEDGTSAIVKDLGESLYVFDKPGKGAALMNGIELAEGTIVMTDADNSYPAEEIPKMLKLLENADIVIGSRYCKGGRLNGVPFMRKFTGLGYSILFRIFFGINDPQSGLKAFRKKSFERVLPIKESGFEWDSVFIAKSKRMGLKIVEHPIVFTDRGKNSNVGILRTTWSMWFNFVCLVLGLK